MADQAFALSPISARAAQPSEEDYDAIREAFMETSRGRWFLGEYAKRNRNADTSMVLDAVARIEETLAAQRQPAPESGLAAALAAIGGAVDEAEAAASAVLDGLALEQHLAPVRKGARVIKEIAWRWREIGADSRICDLLDSQVSAIETACGQISSTEAVGALNSAFDLLKQRLAEFGDGDATVPPAAEKSAPSPSSAASHETRAAAVETAQETSATDDAEAAIGTPAEPVVEAAEAATVVTTEAADMTAEAPDMADEVCDAVSEPTDISPGDTDTFDDALLNMVALEMAAPDPADIDDLHDTDSYEIHVPESLPADPIMPGPADPIFVAERPGPAVAAVEPPAVPNPIEPSLGSSLIANGVVRRPHAPLVDPFAPIRRMSQAEKIAMFS
jgi:hypothetical protein